jgi:signal transduction histidine kinase
MITASSDLSMREPPRSPPKRSARGRERRAALLALAERALQAVTLNAVARVLTRDLPGVLGLPEARLLLWNRRLDRVETLASPQTELALVPAGGPEEPRARRLIVDGRLVDGPPDGDPHKTIVPLMARTSLVGTLILTRAPRGRPFSAAEARLIGTVAARAALSIENLVYHRELVESERVALLGTMAGMLAHDFRGPMTVMRGWAETLEGAAGRSAEVREVAGLIARMVDRLDRMITETLDYARGSERLVRRTVGLRPLLEELAASLELELPGLVVERAFSVPAEASLAVDLDKLRRSLGNLAANSREAGARVFRMEAALGKEGLVLDLSDDGPGVSAEIRDSLFEPFVTRGKRGGTGLGLAVARRFVEDHGGRLELLPEGPGARFRAFLPAASPAV